MFLFNIISNNEYLYELTLSLDLLNFQPQSYTSYALHKVYPPSFSFNCSFNDWMRFQQQSSKID